MQHRKLAWVPVLTLFFGCGDAGGGSGSASSTGVEASSSGGETPTTTEGDGSTGGSDSAGESSGSTGGGGDDPFKADPVCSSGKMWTMGNQESPHMHPGMACLTCHSQMEPILKMRLPVVGTVYPTGHEPDDCLGVDGGAEPPTIVEITTADAKVIQLPVNSSGNFLYDAFGGGGDLMFPITAKVVKGDKERVMLTPQSTGDCNSCHSQNGTNGAPGRIVEPL